MSRFPYNDLFKEQARRVLPATYKRAVISSMNESMGTIDVYFSDSPQSVLKGIMASSAIDFTKVLVICAE